MKHARSRLIAMFLLIFSISCIVQGSLWSYAEYTDEGIWTSAVERFLQGVQITIDDPEYGYPATTLLLPARAFVAAGMSVSSSVVATMTVLISILISCIGLITYVLRPKRLWWLTVTGWLIFHSLYTDATPPSALFSLFFVLIALTLLYIKERQIQTALPFVFLGIANGLALATRLDMALFLLVGEALFLWFIDKKKTWMVVLISGALFLLLDFHMWTMPIEYITGIYHKIHYHYAFKSSSTSLLRILMMSPLGVLSLFLSGALLYISKKEFPLPKTFWLWLMGTTVALGGALYSSDYHPSWYFYPLFFVWEVFFPLFLLTALEKVKTPPSLAWFTQNILKYTFVFLLIAAQIMALLVYVSK